MNKYRVRRCLVPQKTVTLPNSEGLDKGDFIFLLNLPLLDKKKFSISKILVNQILICYDNI